MYENTSKEIKCARIVDYVRMNVILTGKFLEEVV